MFHITILFHNDVVSQFIAKGIWFKTSIMAAKKSALSHFPTFLLSLGGGSFSHLIYSLGNAIFII